MVKEMEKVRWGKRDGKREVRNGRWEEREI
jgi:hypothetical protein